MSSKPLSTHQQLKQQQKLAAAFPLFAEQLAPALPILQAHVAAHGNKDMAPPARFAVGQRVSYLYTAYNGKTYTAAVARCSPTWAYDGRFSGWYYYLTYDEGQIPAAFAFMLELPAREDRLTLLPPASHA